MTDPTPHAALIAAAEALRIAAEALDAEGDRQYGSERQKHFNRSCVISSYRLLIGDLSNDYQPKEASE
jgi:hypothetical protein